MLQHAGELGAPCALITIAYLPDEQNVTRYYTIWAGSTPMLLGLNKLSGSQLEHACDDRLPLLNTIDLEGTRQMFKKNSEKLRDG